VNKLSLAGLMALGAAATIAATPALAGSHAPKERNYILSTASTGGTYYPVGVALSTLVKVKLQPKQKIGMSAINSAGSGENVKLLRENEAQFAILQGLFGYYAVNGVGPVESAGPQKELRSVTMLWQNVEHYVVPATAASSGTVDDIVAMQGKKLGMGKKNSGTIGSNTVIMGNLGLDITKNAELFHAGYGPTVDAFQNGQIDGFGIPAGVPVGAITKVASAMGDKMKILSMSPEQQKKADGDFGLWTPYTIPAGTYPGQDADVQTVAQPNFLAVRADVDEDAVYRITKAIYENLPFLNAIHKATTAMDVQKAIAGLPAPLHPGAAKYYKEVGMEIPENLIAK